MILIDNAIRRLHASLPPCLIVLEARARTMRRLEIEHDPEPDELAQWCHAEALALVRETPARAFEAYVCLEVAAARAPEAFGAGYRSYRDRVMRAILGAARELGVLANVADTTVARRWVGRHRPRVRAELRDHELRVFLEDDRVIVLDRDLGMVEDYDA